MAAKTWESKALSAISLGRQLSSVSSKTILRISILPAAADLLLLSTAQILGMGSCLSEIFSKAVIEKAFYCLVTSDKDNQGSDALSIDESKKFSLVFVVFFLNFGG